MRIKIYSDKLPKGHDYLVKQVAGLGVQLILDNGSEFIGRSFENVDDEEYFEVKDMHGQKMRFLRSRILSICTQYKYWLVVEGDEAKLAFVLPSHIGVDGYDDGAVSILTAGGVEEELTPYCSVQKAISAT